MKMFSQTSSLVVKNSSVDAPEFNIERRAVSSGEPSLDGSVDEERGALSDSDLPGAARIQALATQAKGPSSDALESECRIEQSLLAQNSESSSPNEWCDVLGSGQLLRNILKKGEGVRARNGQYVTIRVVDTGLGIDSFSERSFILGYSMVIDAWEMVLQLMHEGEIDAVKSEYRLAYGTLGDPERNIDPYQTMTYEIELIKVNDGPIYSLLDRNSLIQHVTDLKKRGNYYYGRREIEKALYVYKRSTELIETPISEDETLRDLLSVIYSNISVCYAKLIVKELRRLKAKLKLCREQERTLYKRMMAGAHVDHEHSNHKFVKRLRYPLITFFVIAFALFIHFSRIALGW